MKALYKHLKEIVKKRFENDQYQELVSESHFLKLSIREKVNFINLILRGRIIKKDEIKLQELAYQHLTRHILAYNLTNPDQHLDFIYDGTHQYQKHQITKLLEVVNFIKEHQGFESKHNKISAFAGFKEELRNVFGKVGRAFLEINQGPTHTLHAIDSAFNQAFNRVRRYLKMDPTDKTLVSVVKQFVGGIFNLSVWLSKQAVNAVRKPIACGVNVCKCLANLVSLRPTNAYKNFKDAVYDLKDTAVAWTTAFCAIIFTPFVPLAPATALIVGAMGVHSAANVLLASSAAVKISAHNPLGLTLEAADVAIKATHASVEYLKRRDSKSDTSEEKMALKFLYNIMQNYKNGTRDFENNQIKQKALEHLNSLDEYIKNKKMEESGSAGKLLGVIKEASYNVSSKLPLGGKKPHERSRGG